MEESNLSRNYLTKESLDLGKILTKMIGSKLSYL
jgi:hypothetical protein